MWALNQESGSGRENCRIQWGFLKSTFDCAAQLGVAERARLVNSEWVTEMLTVTGWDKAAGSQSHSACSRSLWGGSLWPALIFKGGEHLAQGRRADNWQALSLLRCMNMTSRALNDKSIFPPGVTDACTFHLSVLWTKRKLPPLYFWIGPLWGILRVLQFGLKRGSENEDKYLPRPETTNGVTEHFLQCHCRGTEDK